jgi:hypothetical protein
MDIQSLSTLAGLFSLGITLLISCIGGFYMVKSGVGKTTSEAQSSTINAMQAEMSILKTRIDDERKENIRLGHVIDTICAALKSKGIIISISGEMITIDIDEHKKSTTIRIQEE